MNRSRNLNYRNGTLQYQISGKGKNLILLHGFGEDSRVWEKQIPILEDNCRIVIPDLPGSGHSDYIPGLKSMEDYADAIHAIVQQENISDLIMIGHSMGGYITLAFVEKYPDLVSGFGLFHSSAYADDDEKKETRKKGIEFIQKHGAGKFLAESIPNLFSDETKNSNPDLVSGFIDRYQNFSADALVQYYEAMIRRPDRTQILRETEKPVLFILGEHDTAVPFQKGLEQAGLPGICYIHVCKHSAHLGMLEEPDFCNKALTEFISSDLLQHRDIGIT